MILEVPGFSVNRVNTPTTGGMRSGMSQCPIEYAAFSGSFRAWSSLRFWTVGKKIPGHNDMTLAHSKGAGRLPGNLTPWKRFFSEWVLIARILISTSSGIFTTGAWNPLWLNQINTSWWFQMFSIFTPTWGSDPIWRAYFSNGRVQTTN